MSRFGGVIFITIFGLFWCSITFLIDGVLTWQLVRQLRASNYSETQGTITHSQVKVESDGEGTSYNVDIGYRFDVSGKTYESKCVRYDFMSMGKERAETLVRKYPAGQVVTVHYNPKAPSDAVLELGPALENFFAALFLTPFNAIALFLVLGLLGTLRSRQLGRPIAGISLRSDGLTTAVRVYERSPGMVALATLGGAGFLATFGVLLGSWAMPFEYAIALGWSATLAAAIAAWSFARQRYSEFLLDVMRGSLEVRDPQGRSCSLARDDVQPVRFGRKTKTDSEGQRTVRFPLELSFLDPETQEPRTLALPEQGTETDAQMFATWLNELLAQLPSK